MNLPETCPFCGAGIAVGDDGEKRVADLCVIFDCGSGVHELMDPIRTRSRACEEITRLAARVAELEVENKGLRDRFSDADTERNAAQAGLKDAFARVAELEARCKRLEEAGDVLQSAVVGVEGMTHWQWLAAAHEADLKWKQAKEAKP